jgi:hypothetical protein
MTAVTRILKFYFRTQIIVRGRIPKLIMEWIPVVRRKRGGTRKTWMEGVQAAMTTRHLEPDQCRNRKEFYFRTQIIVRGQNIETNYGMDTTGEKGKRTHK